MSKYELSKVTDEKKKKKIIKAHERVALKEIHIKTKEEKEIDEFWENIAGGD